jgi:hypothetical protein
MLPLHRCPSSSTKTTRPPANWNRNTMAAFANPNSLLANDSSKMDSSDEGGDCCPICSDIMRSPCLTACGHTFCSACLVQSFKMNRPWNRGPCPICRSAVSVYSTKSMITGDSIEVPAVSTIFGSEYLQSGRPGVASCVVPFPPLHI